MKRFKGKSGIITGSSRGLGKAIAQAFAAEGAFVGIGYHKDERGAKQTISEILEAGGEAMALKADIKDFSAVEKVYKAFLKERGIIDFLINNASMVDDKPFALMSEKSWSTLIQTNLGGTFNFSRVVVRSMIGKKTGAIINIGSVAGLAASPGQANYAASKGGIIAFTRTVAAELAPNGIRVNSVLPGFLNGGMAQRLDQRHADVWRQRIPIGRFGELNEVIKAVLFLTSDEASYIIGQSLVVDGGLTL